jgi:hypothetical protein
MEKGGGGGLWGELQSFLFNVIFYLFLKFKHLITVGKNYTKRIKRISPPDGWGGWRRED